MSTWNVPRLNCQLIPAMDVCFLGLFLLLIQSLPMVSFQKQTNLYRWDREEWRAQIDFDIACLLLWYVYINPWRIQGFIVCNFQKLTTIEDTLKYQWCTHMCKEAHSSWKTSTILYNSKCKLVLKWNRCAYLSVQKIRNKLDMKRDILSHMTLHNIFN